MKKLIGVLLFFAVSFVIYQIQKPILTEEEAVSKASEYVKILNDEHEEANYNPNAVTVVYLENKDWISTVLGTKVWTVFVDGIAIDINAYNGDFERMIFPLDGVITKDTFPKIN